MSNANEEDFLRFSAADASLSSHEDFIHLSSEQKSFWILKNANYLSRFDADAAFF